ncbi:MAG: DEAD/DEAH box helicase, partial [Candidatus Brockarchaeota archaeon]|nr:DEAD/DEAH box helicase [Candidatus Brockarchaeota archaeon]
SKEWVKHPMIKPDALEVREYQVKIAKSCLNGNTLVCLPTGLGKTLIALLATAEMLRLKPQSKVIFLSPTRPLVLQHLNTFRKILALNPWEMEAVTGSIAPNQRVNLWNKKVVFSTPQVLMNDLLTGKADLSQVSMIIFDEAHRAVGDYAYTFIAERASGERGVLLLGLTASPGVDEDEINVIKRNLYMEKVEARTLSSSDIKPYVSTLKVEWVKVLLPQKYREAITRMESYVKGKLKPYLGSLSTAQSKRVRLRDILALVSELKSSSEGGKGSRLAEVYSTIHALKVIELIETQSLESALEYVENLKRRLEVKRSASAKLFLESGEVAESLSLIKEAAKEKVQHPKIPKLLSILRDVLMEARRVMVFTNYRSTASQIVTEVNQSLKGVASAVRLIGQSTKYADRGLSQKEQTFIIEDFKSGFFNVLIATQIGEEGLDIAECDVVIFYDTVPSAIRYIQRRGRTGRSGPGKVIIMMTEGSRDEAYYWAVRKKEETMIKALSSLETKERGQRPLENFFMEQNQKQTGQNKIKIIVDSRESSSQVINELCRLNVETKLETLSCADYILSDEVAVERKTSEDLAASIVDGRLFDQASRLKETYGKPIIIVEGESLTSPRDVKPESIAGAVSSLLVDYQIPVVRSANSRETALLLYFMAKREQRREGKEPRIRGGKRPSTLKELQEYVVAGLPNIDVKLARRLLKRFKSVEAVFTASAKDLMEVEGIGEKKSKKIREVLTANYAHEGS